MLAISSLKKRADFLAAAKSGMRKSTNSFILQVKPNNLEGIRVGYTISKKVSKLAVIRNRIKRRLKAAVKATEKSFKPGYDYVFIGKFAAESRCFKQLEEDIKYALKNVFVTKG